MTEAMITLVYGCIALSVVPIAVWAISSVKAAGRTARWEQENHVD